MKFGLDLSDESIDNLSTFLSSKSEGRVVLTPEVANAFRSAFDKHADALAAEIGRCFGIGEIHALTRKSRTNAARIAMRRRMSNGSEFGIHTLSLGCKTEFKTTIPAGIPIPHDCAADDTMNWFLPSEISALDKMKGDDSDRKFAIINTLMSLVGDLLMPSAVGVLRLPAFYLPADRTGVMHAHSVVVSALIANAPTAGLRPAARTPMLSGVLADFLGQLIEIDRPGRPRRKRGLDLGTRIEQDVLDGSVRVDRSTSTGYPRFAYRPKNWKENLALANASSMVSELAPVVLGCSPS